MAINITTTTNRTVHQDDRQNHTENAARKMPGWLWFIVLWCFGVGSAVSLGYAFKLLMNATLFAVK